MAQSFRDILLLALERSGRSLRSIHTETGVSYETLKNLKQGKSQNTNPLDASRIARAFNVSLEDFMIGRIGDDPQGIAVAGKVGAGATVPLVDPYEKGDGLYHVAAPPQLRGRHGIVAVEVEGDSMTPLYQPGDVLFYTRATHEGILSEDRNLICVVEDADGQAWVKQVRPGDEPDLFHLISLNGLAETRYNQRIRWASRVIMALPGVMVERA